MSYDLPYYKFLLKNPKTGEYYYVNNWQVYTSVTVKEVEAPINWGNTEIKWIRSISYLGLIRSLTTPYEFIHDGYIILKYLFARNSFEAECVLEILIRSNVDWTYSTLAEFGLDFSTSKIHTVSDENALRQVFAINAIEDGPYKFLRENESTPYEFPFDNTASDIKLDGVKLDAVYDFAPVAGSINITQTGSGTNLTQVYASTAFYQNEGAYDVCKAQSKGSLFIPAGGIPVTTNVGDVLDPVVYDVSPLEAIVPMTMFLEKNLEVQIDNHSASTTGIQLQLRLVVADNTRTITQSVVIWTGATIAPGVVSNFMITPFPTAFSISLNKEDRAYLIYEFVKANTGTVIFDFTWFGNPNTGIQFYDKWHASFVRDASLTKAYKYYQLYYKIITALTGGQYQGYSQYLSNPLISDSSTYFCAPGKLFVTCGDALRQFSAAKIKTNLKEFFQDCKTQFCTGLGVDSNNRIIIEPLSVFFDRNTLIADLGEVNLTAAPATEFIFSNLKAGYPNVSYDDLNGRNEYNAGQSWKLKVSRIQRDEDWTSSYRADCYGIEYNRLNIINKKTVDTSSDNDTFLIQAENSNIYNLFKPTSVTGVPYPTTVYNAGLTPKRKLLRNRPLLLSVLWNVNKVISFQSADKNSSLQTFFTNSNITEGSDLNVLQQGGVNVSASALFQPVIFRFATLVPKNLQTLLQNPYGYFSFTYKGNVFKGFLMEVAMKPHKKTTYEWVLLSHPDNDLSLL